MSLYKKFFVDPIVADEEERDAETIERAQARTLVDCSYYAEVKKKLAEFQEQADPVPGDFQKMLYQAGVRDGIKLVRQYFDALEESVR